MLDVMHHEITMAITGDEAGEMVADAVARRLFLALPDGAVLIVQIRWFSHMADDRLRRSIKPSALLVNAANPLTSRTPAPASMGSS